VKPSSLAARPLGFPELPHAESLGFPAEALGSAPVSSAMAFLHPGASRPRRVTHEGEREARAGGVVDCVRARGFLRC
jgi:hypothetical protein